jgi:hypothetical protein
LPPPLDIPGGTPVLLVGEGDKATGEIWLTNASGTDVKVTKASLSVTLATGVETGEIKLPPDALVPARSTRRLLVNAGLLPFTAPGTYPASVDLETSAGPQSIAASFVVLSLFRLAILDQRQVFTGVAGGATVNGSVVVRNAGNVPIAVEPIADEPLLEVTPTDRLLVVDATGGVAVQPSIAATAIAGVATFANATPAIPVGGWADVTYSLTTPAVLPARAHIRVLPRIATERFAIDLLTP